MATRSKRVWVKRSRQLDSVLVLRNWILSELASLLDNVSELPDTCHPHTNMARPLLKTQRRVAKGQSIRWKRDLRHLAAREVSTALQEQRREYRARSQAHEIGSALESFLFWLSFILFRVVRIMSAAALEALRKELPYGTTVGQNGRAHQDPAVVEDGDSVLSQGDPPSGVKKQVPSVRDMAVQVDQPQHVPIKVPLEQPSRTPLLQAAMRADLPQHSPVTPRTDGPQQTKDVSRKDHLQAPKEALDAPRSQQSTARNKIYVMVQPMPAPGTVGTPYFTGQNVSQFIEQYERLCVQYHVISKEKHQGLPEYCDYWIGMWIRSLPKFIASN